MKSVALTLGVFVLTAGLCSLSSAAGLQIGDSAPDFSLPGVDGKEHSLNDYKDSPVLVVVFTCNTCPVAQAYEERLIAIQKAYADKGVVLVGINPNSLDVMPGDSLEKMKERAAEKGYNFPYLRDDSQEVARAYGARVTPHVFVFNKDRKLVYKGRIDDNRNPVAVTTNDLRNALDAVLEGRPVEPAVTAEFGCTVKWK